ncbi:MAG: class I SAM-dependent methyltransferase [Candidatus Omnitrophica bacterium]|nr:class I SAM-dependent methyltransferase [Candidatus Omnitrophota bacterium]
MGFLDRFLKPSEEKQLGDFYGNLYDGLIEFHENQGLSEEDARKQAIGGDYETFGHIERDALLAIGYTGEEFLVDLGCGSGRLARKLAPLIKEGGAYLGLDVNQTLIHEARQQVAKAGGGEAFQFKKIVDPVLPCPEKSVNLLVAFSVVTHIDLEDTYNYFVELKRTLKPTGRALISYLSTEIEGHWNVFIQEAEMKAGSRNARVRNHVMVPGTLNRLAEKSGLAVLEDHPADFPWIPLTESVEMDGKKHNPGERIHLGQSCLILQPAP